MLKKVLAILAFLSVFILVGLLGGCTPIEKSAYRTVVASKAFLDSMKKAHPECTQVQSPVTKVCTLLVQATAAKDLVIDAGEIYCQGNLVACTPIKKTDSKYQAAITTLQAALSNYEQIEKDLKGAIQ